MFPEPSGAVWTLPSTQRFFVEVKQSSIFAPGVHSDPEDDEGVLPNYLFRVADLLVANTYPLPSWEILRQEKDEPDHQADSPRICLRQIMQPMVMIPSV